MLEELLLQRVQLVALGHAFDGADFLAVHFRGQHQARADEAAVDGDGARAAVARRATFLGADQLEFVAQDFEEGLISFAKGFDGVAVNGECDVVFHYLFLARS